MGRQCPIPVERGAVEHDHQDTIAAWTEKLDYLEQAIHRRDRKLEKLRSTVKEQEEIITRLRREKEELERRLNERGKPHVLLTEKDRNHYGDRDYWTRRKLYVLRETAGLSYRELEQKTGIPKSTIQRRVKEHRKASSP